MPHASLCPEVSCEKDTWANSPDQGMISPKDKVVAQAPESALICMKNSHNHRLFVTRILELET